MRRLLPLVAWQAMVREAFGSPTRESKFRSCQRSSAGAASSHISCVSRNSNAVRFVSVSGVILRAAGVASGASSYSGDGG